MSDLSSFERLVEDAYRIHALRGLPRQRERGGDRDRYSKEGKKNASVFIHRCPSFLPTLVSLPLSLSLSLSPLLLPHNIEMPETNQLRMSAERVGAMLRETMEPAPARLAATGAMITAEQAGHYCVPVKLKRLYRERKLGSPFAKGDEDRYAIVRMYATTCRSTDGTLLLLL